MEGLKRLALSPVQLYKCRSDWQKSPRVFTTNGYAELTYGFWVLAIFYGEA